MLPVGELIHLATNCNPNLTEVFFLFLELNMILAQEIRQDEANGVHNRLELTISVFCDVKIAHLQHKLF